MTLCFAEIGAKKVAKLSVGGLISAVLAGERNGFLLQDNGNRTRPAEHCYDCIHETVCPG